MTDYYLNPNFDPMDHFKDNHDYNPNYAFGSDEKELESFERDETHDSQVILNLRKKYPR